MLDLTKAHVLAELQGRVGRANGIHVRQLVRSITGATEDFELLERKVRDHVQVLRLEGHPICAHPSSGYHMAEPGTSELDDSCAFLIARAETSLDQVAAMKRRDTLNLWALLGVPTPTTKGA